MLVQAGKVVDRWGGVSLKIPPVRKSVLKEVQFPGALTVPMAASAVRADEQPPGHLRPAFLKAPTEEWAPEALLVFCQADVRSAVWRMQCRIEP